MEYQIENIYIKRFLYFNLYIIRGKNGDILIDTGFIGMRRQLKKWLDKFNVKLIILTHAHVDHIWNASYIKKIYNCQIGIGYKDIDNIDNAKIHSTPSKKKYNRWAKLMNYGMKKFVPESFDINLYLKDNQIIKRYGQTLRIVSLSGHTNGSIGILYKDYLFAGDAIVNRKKQPNIAYQNQNNEEAINSYQKIINLSPKIIFVGHDQKVTIDQIKNIRKI